MAKKKTKPQLREVVPVAVYEEDSEEWYSPIEGRRAGTLQRAKALAEEEGWEIIKGAPHRLATVDVEGESRTARVWAVYVYPSES